MPVEQEHKARPDTATGGRVVVVGDNIISSERLVAECGPFRAAGYEIVSLDWLAADLTQLQEWNLKVEKGGAEVIPPVDGLAKVARQTDVLITHFCPIPRRVIEAGEKLKVVAVARGGVENVAVQAATQRGIAVMHIVGRHASAVAEFALGLMLAEMRHIARAHTAMLQGRWYRDSFNTEECMELNTKTVGLVGFGAIARVLVRRLSGFDVRVLAYDPYVPADEIGRAGAEPTDLETLLRQSDVVSLHARLMPETRGMIGRRELEMMKPTAYLINTARAGLIDEAALVNALQTKQIKGAALDVFEQEPLPVGHPLCRLDNVTLTSHQSGSTWNLLDNSVRMVAQAAYRYLFEGWMDWVVNRKEI